ncbi:MAG: helix-turn-helix domain-containing protein [Thermodesulfobacteriota bacterium]
MKNIVIFAPRHTSAVTVLGPMEVFFLAGVLANQLRGAPATPHFSVTVASLDGNPVPCLNRAMISPHCSIRDVEKADTVLVGALSGDVEKALAAHLELPRWLREMADKGADMASVCTGAFLLAEAGLLDGKHATTHWGWADIFRKRYPKVKLAPEKVVSRDQKVFCAGGANACFDLALYLVELYCGREVSLETAKVMLHDTGRTHQAPYSVFYKPAAHGDDAVSQVQDYLEQSYRNHVGVDDLARRFGLGRRTLERRFKAATGTTPLGYLQQVRLAAAKDLLETSGLSFDEIAWKTGYGDSGFFRKLFLQQTGVTPREYRKKFQQKNV